MTAEATKYYHFDHLGSVTALTDSQGRVIGPAWDGANATVFKYDAWGTRVNPDPTNLFGPRGPVAFNPQVGHREFTSHETIPNVGLLNMNGRVYDPELGRFLTPDPNVQFVANPQSYNRYTYAANNPLRYTDPTGYGALSFLTSGSFWGHALQVLEVAAGAAACASVPESCIGVGLALAALNAGVMAARGATFDQVVAGFVIGSIAGGWGGMVGAGTGMLAGSVVGGLVGGAVSAAMMTAMTGGGWGDLGKNVAIGMASGAVAAGVAWSIQGTNPVSEASAAEQQGGGGSGADRLEAFELDISRREGTPAAELLGNRVSAENLREGLKLLGAEGVLDVLQENDVEVDLYAPGKVTGTAKGGGLVEMPDRAVAWTRWRGDSAAVYINQNATTEQAIVGLMHEYTHLLGGDETAAWATTVDISLKLGRLGGVLAGQDPISGLITNGRVNMYAVQEYLAARQTDVGSLYSLTARQIYPESVARLF